MHAWCTDLSWGASNLCMIVYNGIVATPKMEFVEVNRKLGSRRMIPSSGRIRFAIKNLCGGKGMGR